MSQDVLLEIIWSNLWTSIFCWEVVVFQVVVIFLGLRLSVCQRHNEEIRLKLCYHFSLVYDCRHGFIRCRSSNSHFWTHIRLCENVISFEGLALIWNHVCINKHFKVCTLASWFYSDSDKLWDLLPRGVHNLILLLILCNLSDFLLSQKHILSHRGEDPANLFKSERFGNAVNLLLIGIV